MKSFIAIAAAILSVSVFAIDSSDSWSSIREEVKASHNLKINSGYAVFVGRITTAFNVCIDGENFKTTKPFPIYERVRLPGGRDNDRYKDVVVGYEYLTFPITREVTRKVCYGRNDNRCKTVTKIEVQDTVKDISVAKRVRRGGRDRDDKWKTLFTKTYVIPACN